MTLLGGAPIPAPITLDATPGSETISVYETDYVLTANYDVQVTVTDPKTGLTNTEVTFKVSILCTKSVDLISDQIFGISYEIDLDDPWALDVTVPSYQQNPVACAVGTINAVLVYTGAGAAPGFIVQDTASNINVATQDPANVGTYDYKIVATDSLTGVFNEVDVFQATIEPPTYATSLNIVPVTAIADLNYLVSDPQVQLDVAQYTILPVDADLSLIYTLGASTPAFVTLLNPSAGVYKVAIQTGDTANTGIYSIDVIFTE